jgi:hypothetical protein
VVTFHLSELLQPETNYTVTLPIRDEIVTWNFTTGNFTIGTSTTNEKSELPSSFVIVGTFIAVIAIIFIAAVTFKKEKRRMLSHAPVILSGLFHIFDYRIQLCIYRGQPLDDF